MSYFYYLCPLILQTAIWPIVRPLFRFFLHLEVRGSDGGKIVFIYDRIQILSLRKNGVIFVVNHGSELDPIFVPASLPFLSPFMPMFYTSREQGFYQKSGWRRLFYGGLLFKLWGSHRLNSGKQNYEVSLAPHIEILKNGYSLCMFPGGKRFPESEIGNIVHGGVGYLAWKTNAVVVPVRISGAHLISLKEFFTRKRRVSVSFGTPIYSRELFGGGAAPDIAQFKSAAATIMNRIKNL